MNIPKHIDNLLTVFIGKNPNVILKYLDGLLIKEIFAKTYGKITTSPESPGSNFFADGYLTGDIDHVFKELWEVIVNGERFMILLTDSSIYCCSNSGEYRYTVTREIDTTSVTSQIIIPSPILKLMYKFQGDKEFSKRIYILKGMKYISLMIQAKKNLVFARKFEGVVIISTNTGSLYVFIR